MNNHYPYVNAILRSIENKIFDKSKWQKLAKTDKNSFFKTLTELGYGKSESAGTLEELIDQELLGVKALIDELTPQKNYTDLFFFQSDAINIRYFFKQKYFGITHFDVYVPLGTIPKETLKKAILEGDYNGLDKPVRKLMQAIEKNVQGITNPRIFSTVIDQTIFDYIFDQFNLLTSPALKTYFQTYIDSANLLTFLRSRELKWDQNTCKEMLLTHGGIELSRFLESYSLPLEKLSKLWETEYNGQISRIIKAYNEHQNLDMTHNALDKLMLEEIRRFKYDAFDIGPVIYYYLLKVAEAKNIRMIYAQAGNEQVDMSQMLEY